MNKFNRKAPYNDLPLLPPKVDVETKEVLRKTISAGRALAQLNGTLLNLPNPTLFLDTIYLQEAKASSEVENIITTNDELYKSLVADRKVENLATKEVLSYKEALWLGLEQLKKKTFYNNKSLYQYRSMYKTKYGFHSSYTRNNFDKHIGRSDLYTSKRRKYH